MRDHEKSLVKVAVESLGMKRSCKEVYSLRETIVECTAEDPSILEMPIPCDDHQEE